MKLATALTSSGTVAVRIDSETATVLPASDVGLLLQDPDWHELAASASGVGIDLAELRFAAPIAKPGKVVCVGLNYRRHILEMGRELPTVPTLFAKYGEALVGPEDDILLPPESSAMDWEGELAVVIGAPVRRVSEKDAVTAIAGYTILNDVTARDFQYRTTQWLQGKTFESTTPFGPVIVTADEFDMDATITTEVDGEIVQESNLTDLVIGPAQLVSYISTIMTLRPGDIIATGTPAGVGHAMDPPRYLRDGSQVVTRISGIGELRNVCRRDASGTSS